MTSELDDFDSLIEAQEVKPERKTNIAIKDMVVNPDVAAQLIKGRPITAVALDLGVNPATIRRWMRTMEMKDLLAIEARRALMHMSRRKLGGEKYLALATGVKVMLEAEDKLRNAGNEKPNSGIINQTFVERLNVLIQRPGNEREGLPDERKVAELTAEGIPEIPQEFDSEGSGEPGNPDGDGSKE